MAERRKIKRYLVFCWDKSAPTGSEKEIDSDFDSPEDALLRALEMAKHFDNVEIFDTVDGVYLFQKVITYFKENTYTVTFTTISQGFGNFGTLPESTIEENAEFNAKFKKAHADLIKQVAENLGK